MLKIDPHELLDAGVFTTSFRAPLGEMPPSPAVQSLLSRDAHAPFTTDDACRKAIRDLLRKGGYKPTGRGKPASEYLAGAALEGTVPSINLAVDTCNAVSLQSGLPISVIDLDRSKEPLRIGLASEGQSYAFNASGQTIDLAGLLCLFDADGPCANAVKDSQRTKTHEGTVRTLTVVWGTKALPGRTRAVVEWYTGLLAGAGASTERLAT
jgi:DNA/RNA-binding domain of Phe-tRNA-synthetase-like protein